MAIKHFEDIIAWKKAQDLAVELYKLFGESRDFCFKDQILRAVVSISNNVAEGFDRGSDADFRRFLFIANGSCSEVRSMLHLARRLDYINDKQKLKLIQESTEISRVIAGLIKTLTK